MNRITIRTLLPMIVCVVISGALFMSRTSNGNYGVETDFYGYYAPHAKSIVENHKVLIDDFRGPLYPAVLAVFAVSGLSYFHAAIVLNLLCLTFCFVGMLRLMSILRVGGDIGLWLFALSPIVWVYAAQAGTDIFFMAMCVWAVVMAHEQKYMQFGAIAAAAILTRTNGMFLLLIPAFQMYVASTDKKRIAMSFVLPAIAFMLWGSYTYSQNGHFFHNMNYLNTAALKYTNTEQFWYDISAQPSGWFQTLNDKDVLWALVKNYPNVCAGIIGVVAFPIVLLCLWGLRHNTLLFVSVVSLCLPMFLVHTSDRFYIPLLPLICIGLSNEVFRFNPDRSERSRGVSKNRAS
jgi:hypothetical protein